MAPKSWGTANCSHTLSLRSGRGFPTDGAELAPSKQGEADEVQPKPSWDRVCELQSWEMAPAGMLRHRSLLELLLVRCYLRGLWKGGWGGCALGSSCQEDILSLRLPVAEGRME